MRLLAVPFVLALVALATATNPGAAATSDPAASELLLDFQKMERFRDRLRRAVFHVSVLEKVEPGFDPAFRQALRGAAAVIRLPDGQTLFVTSERLVRNADTITLVRREGRTSPARVVRTLPDLGVALLEVLAPGGLDETEPLPLVTAPEALAVGTTLFSLDNLASGFEVVCWGDVAAEGEPPLEALRVVRIALFDGHPLVDAAGRFAGLCFREVLPGSGTCFASSAADLLRTLVPPEPKAGEPPLEPTTVILPR